jgi:hypothetical protein
MSRFVKVNSFYVNIDSIAVVEEKGEVLTVRLNTQLGGVPSADMLRVKIDSSEGVDLLNAIKERVSP